MIRPFCMLLVLLGSTAHAADDGPIKYIHEVRGDPKLHLHVVKIDLTDPRVELAAFPCGPDPDGAGPWQVTLDQVRATAARHDLDVAINANFFMARQSVPIAGRRVGYFVGNWGRAVGWLVSDGRVISRGVAEASLIVDRRGRVRIGRFERLPADARHVVSGSQQIITRGEVTARDVMEPQPGSTKLAPARAPRTAVGISADHATLVLLVVDGRRLTHSVGMSESELAGEMLRLGCHDAINLDGGGSSTLVLRNGPAAGASTAEAHNDGLRVMNRPSDGHDLAFPLSLERAVACIFGARVRRGGDGDQDGAPGPRTRSVDPRSGGGSG